MHRYRVALFGTSFARTVQVPGFQRHPGFELVAIAGSQLDKTRRIAGELGIPGAYDDWRQLLEREKPDAAKRAVFMPVAVDAEIFKAAAFDKAEADGTPIFEATDMKVGLFQPQAA